jgi:cephalosporin hydroxylase
MVDVSASVGALDRLARRGQAAKLPEDLDRYALVIERTRPELIVECGTWQGYSAEWFAGFGLDVVTIDVDPRESAWIKDHGDHRDQITYLTGSSTDPHIIGQATGLAAGRRTMVVLDSDHSGPHVYAEIAAYAPLVTPGCFLIVEDGICRWLQGMVGGPLDAVEELLVGHPEWQRDESVETLHPISTNPMGWWLRVPK